MFHDQCVPRIATKGSDARNSQLRISSLLLIAVAFFLPVRAQENSSPQAATSHVEQRVDSLLKQLTLDEKIDLIGGVDDFYIRGNKHIGLPRLKMADGPFGVRNYGPSTTLGGLCLAATWDTNLAQRVGATIGEDARARGVHFMLGPGVNVYRAPMNGRNFEYFGEDPFLASRIAVGYIEGMQSQGVSSTIKHFLGNNQEYDRHNVDSVIDERTMREIYLPTFEAAVKDAHVGAIMDSYNLTNGQHMTQNAALNIDLLKKEWGFDGIVMSDWDSTYDGVAAARSGLDLEMPAGGHMNRATLLPAVKSGAVSEAAIDDKVRRILRTAIRFGWLDHDQANLSIPLLNPEGDEVALEVARSGMVLLKNQNHLLPLDKTRINSIAVIGPDAYPAQAVGGGSAGVEPFVTVSYLQGLESYLGKDVRVYYQRGIPTLGDMADATKFSIDPGGHQPGLKVELFRNANLEGAPAAERTDQHLDTDATLGYGTGSTEASARWSGYFTPRVSGNYVIFVQGQGEGSGYRFYIDDKLLIDNWDRAYALVNEITVPLEAGPHRVRLDYFARWAWQGASMKLGIVRPEDVVNRDAKKLAERCDAAILAVGFTSESESEGSDRTFELPPAQDELIREIAAANRNTILVITSGGGVAMPWINEVPAVLESWYPGQEGGRALAQLLFGDYSPSGKLPVSFERRWEDNAVRDSYYPETGNNTVTYSEGVLLGYRHFDKAGIKPLFPFGFGLSYTTFAYKHLSINPDTVSEDQSVTLGFDVTNTGIRPGAEIAEVYVGEAHAPVSRPVKELKGFTKVDLLPGESKRVSITLDRRAFSWYDVRKHGWTADAGKFNLYVGSSSEQIELTGEVMRR